MNITSIIRCSITFHSPDSHKIMVQLLNDCQVVLTKTRRLFSRIKTKLTNSDLPTHMNIRSNIGRFIVPKYRYWCLSFLFLDFWMMNYLQNCFISSTNESKCQCM